MTKYISRKKAKRIIADSIFKIGFLEDTLKKDYPYILDAINKEDCFLMGDMYQIFKELIYDNKVVGFATYDLGFKDFEEDPVQSCYEYCTVQTRGCETECRFVL